MILLKKYRIEVTKLFFVKFEGLLNKGIHFNLELVGG